jgi:hypothetical protein
MSVAGCILFSPPKTIWNKILMNADMQRRALATHEALLALLELKKVIEAAQTTHAAELEAIHSTIRPPSPRS